MTKNGNVPIDIGESVLLTADNGIFVNAGGSLPLKAGPALAIIRFGTAHRCVRVLEG